MLKVMDKKIFTILYQNVFIWTFVDMKDSFKLCSWQYLRNGFNFWNVHGIMNTSGLLQSYRDVLHVNLARDLKNLDSMNIPKMEFIAFIYIWL